jgi:hypothetical protein
MCKKKTVFLHREGKGWHKIERRCRNPKRKAEPSLRSG